jgi:hypothetical protein
VATPRRLVTFVDLADEAAGLRNLSARHEAVLADESRVLLLDDRGWTTALLHQCSPGGARPGDLEDSISVEDVEDTARIVVGPDEPAEGGSQADAEADHWAYLAGVLERQGVGVDPRDLKRLPHEVVLSERVLARLRR